MNYFCSVHIDGFADREVAGGVSREFQVGDFHCRCFVNFGQTDEDVAGFRVAITDEIIEFYGFYVAVAVEGQAVALAVGTSG